MVCTGICGGSVPHMAGADPVGIPVQDTAGACPYPDHWVSRVQIIQTWRKIDNRTADTPDPAVTQALRIIHSQSQYGTFSW